MDAGVPTRREFVVRSGSCAAYMSASFAFASPGALGRWATSRGGVVAQEAWGRLEEVGSGLWALISTPQTGDFTTISNGAIIAGRNGLIIFEATGTDEGAAWMAEQARELAGRAPTHVVISHHHGDHTAGVGGFAPPESAPAVHVTAATRDRVASGIDAAAEPARARPWADVTIVGVDAPTEIDLGDRTAVIRPYEGHTESDLTLDMPDDDITWCGDLIWNGWFPNYTDATPSRLRDTVASIRRDGRATYIPGHGPIAGPSEVQMYADVLDHVEAAARSAFERGQSAEEAAAAYSLPDHAAAWTIFNPQFFERAMRAWMRELQD